MKILIAGLGSIGRRHLNNLIALGERDILLYHTGKSTLPEDELGGFEKFADLADALAQMPDAAIIANPTSQHMDVAIEAARSGCHLFIEKPLSHSLDRVDELSTAVEGQGLKVLVGYQFRFHPGLGEIKGLLEVKAIGRSLSFHAHWGEYLPLWHPWEDYRQGYSARGDLGGGVLLTLCHPLDYLHWLFGELEVVGAMLEQIGELDIDVEDTAEILLRSASGAVGSLHLDYNQQPPSHYLEVVGSSGTIRWDNSDGSVSVYRSHVQAWEQYPCPPGFERNSLFVDEMRHFLDVVRGASTPICTLEDGVRSLQLIQDAKNLSEKSVA